MNDRSLAIGTRGSPLALWQASWVAEQLTQRGVKCHIVTIATRGDLRTDVPVEAIGPFGVFTKELQKALLDGRIDLAVHSLKDLPTEPSKGTVLAAVPPRESPFDALISHDGKTFDQLPNGARIGTGSLRRQTQLRHRRPDLEIVPVRGNVDTRLQKLRDGQFDAMVLAQAGLTRLGLASEITEVLPPSLMLPAVGQGALGLETRAGDQEAREALAKLDDLESHQAVLAERAMLATLRGGCLAPVGAWARLEDDGRLRLTACVLSRDGTRRIAADLLANAADAVPLGRQVAEKLLAEGAAEMIDQSRTV